MERYLSLRKAAKEAGVCRETLKARLGEDLGILVPPVRQGSKVLIRMSDVEFVLRKRSARRMPMGLARKAV